MAGALAARVGDRALITTGLSLQAAGFVWIAFVAREHLGYAAIVAPLVLAGCGVSMAMVAAQNCVIGAVPPAEIGKAAGTFNTLRQLGGTFGIAILAAVFTSTGSYASARAFRAPYRGAGRSRTVAGRSGGRGVRPVPPPGTVRLHRTSGTHAGPSAGERNRGLR